jgi:hypothetical protein
MYCIRKFADCWAVFNLDTDENRRLTKEEVELIRQEIPELDDPQVAAYYSDSVDCISGKP